METHVENENCEGIRSPGREKRGVSTEEYLAAYTTYQDSSLQEKCMRKRGFRFEHFGEWTLGRWTAGELNPGEYRRIAV